MKKNYEKFLPTYICDIQEINNLSKVMFMSNFPHHQFILCTSGTGKICTENNIEQTVSKGDIVFINSSILFSLRQQENFSIKRIASVSYTHLASLQLTRSLLSHTTMLFEPCCAAAVQLFFKL